MPTGLQPGKIILLNGTSSSGKTSVLRAVQASFSEPYLDLGIDKFIWAMPERYLDRLLWDDVLGLATQAGGTGHRLFGAMHHAIAAAARQGMNVVADHVLVEPRWVVECAALFHDLPAWLVAIRCPLDVLEARERARKNRTLGQARAQFDLVHAHAVYDLEVDTSLMSPEECAHATKGCLESGAPPTAFRLLNAARAR